MDNKTMNAEAEHIWSVGELTGAVGDLLEGAFPSVQVRGEISNLRRQASGHLYFTLKDADAQLSAVCFRGEAMRLGCAPRDGLEVVARGRLTVYAPRGQYQIRVLDLRPVGQGSLQERFEALKRKLQAEGLFDDSRKRPLPVFPHCVGVVTSPTGAALQDFLNIIGRRCPRLRIVVAGARVQGEGAAREVAAAIAELNRRGDVDVIVVARGGGSLEDLWAFNEEAVARAVAASAVPVVSAVGHETDFTICDFVADLRAPTPSAAAELVSRADAEWREQLRRLAGRMAGAAEGELASQAERLRGLANHYALRQPVRLVENYVQRVSDCRESLERGLKRFLLSRRERLERAGADWRRVHPRTVLQRKAERLQERAAQLRLLSPQGTLERGYVLVLDRGGKVVARKAALPGDGEVRLKFADGQATAWTGREG
jgi:exodeoxyribonuclease VII large subunit